MKTFIISRKDGGVSVMRIYSENTVEEEIQKWHADDQANVASTLQTTEDKILPQDEFRDSWTLQGADIVYDLEKARTLQLDRIRIERQPLLAALDVQYQMADEKGDDAQKKTIAAQKQALRDATEALKAQELSSIEDVRAAMPDLNALIPAGELNV